MRAWRDSDCLQLHNGRPTPDAKTGTDLGHFLGAIGANGAVGATLPMVSPGLARFFLLDTQKVRGSSPLRPTIPQGVTHASKNPPRKWYKSVPQALTFCLKSR